MSTKSSISFVNKVLTIFFVAAILISSAGTTISTAQAQGAATVTIGEPGLSFRFIRTFGKTSEPYLPDSKHINQPNGIFIDSSNNLYVAEEAGSRIMKFNLASPAAATLVIGHAGLPWHHEDYVSFPKDVAVRASDGHIWIVANPMVKEFDENGTVIQTIPSTNPWEGGSDDYHFNDPYGLAFGPGGYLFVSDQWNHRIQIYDVSSGTPTYLATIGTTGVAQSDDSGFNAPMQIAFDSSNRLYVMDRINYRVQRCTSSSPWTTWTCTTFFGETGIEGNDSSHLSAAEGIGIDSNDNIFIADGLNYRVLKCNTLGFCSLFAGQTSILGSDNSHFKFIDDVEVDSAGNVYVSDTQNFRVQKFNNLGVYKSTIGKAGVPYLTDPSHLNAPWGIAVAPDGSIYVLEHRGLRLIKMNAAGVQQWIVGQPGVSGSNNTHFGAWRWDGPEGNPALDGSGRIYVPDTNNNRIQIYNATGSYYATLGSGSWGSGNYEFAVPQGIAISPVNGDIYVTDMGNHRIQVFTSARIYKATLGETGVEGDDDAHFRWPRGVAVASNGDIFVADSDNHRVQKCNFTSGINYTCSTFAGETGTPPDGSYNYVHPLAVALDAMGRVYAADEWVGRIMVYDSTGSYLTSISNNFSGPAGVAVDKKGNVYVADRDNHRLQKFSPGVPGWKQTNINGFGDPGFPTSLSMAVFDNQLYAGAATWNGSGASIWRTSDGSNWSSVMTSGFGFPDEIPAVIGMIAFDGYLYAGTGWGGAPGRLWRSANGTSWDEITGNGIGVNTGAIGAFAIYNNSLYLGTCGDDGLDGVQIWRSTTGDSSSWASVVTGGNTTTDNTCITGLTIFNGALYAAVENQVTGAQIWRSASGDSGSWSQVNTSGFGSANNDLVGGFAVFNGYLYIGTHNLSTGAQLWRSSDGTTWNPVMTNGFGDLNNNKLEALFAFGNGLYAGLNNSSTGFEVWHSNNGTTWNQINPNGFGDSSSDSTLWSNEIVMFNNELYLGVNNNANGTEIWKYLRPVVTNINTVTDTGDGSLSEGEQVIVPVTKLTVSFNKDIKKPAVSLFTLKKGTTLITVNSVSYDSLTRTVTLNINDGKKLPYGTYTLTIKKNIVGTDQNTMAVNVIRRFTLVKPPSIPTLIAPANKAVVNTSQPKLDWSNSSFPAGTAFDHYQLQIATDAAFTDPVEQNTDISEFTLLSALNSGTKYYWRVRAYNTLGQASAWSTVFSFTTP